MDFNYYRRGDAAKSLCTLEDVWVDTLAAGGGNNVGFAFLPGGVGTTQHRSAILRNVTVGPAYAATGYFDTGIDLTGCRRPLLDNVRVNGIYGVGTGILTKSIAAFSGGNIINLPGHGFLQDDTGTYSGTSVGGLTNGTQYWVIYIDANNFQLATSMGNADHVPPIPVAFSATAASGQQFILDDFSDTSDLYKMETGVKLDNCYGPSVYDLDVISATLGLSLGGTTQEGGTISDVVMTGVRGGIFYKRTGPQPDVFIERGQINYRDFGISLTSIRAFWIREFSMRQNPSSQRANFQPYSSWPGAGAPCDVYIDDNMLSASQISMMIHETDGDARRIGYYLGGDTDGVFALTISHPMFGGRMAAAVRVGNADTKNVVVQGVKFAATGGTPASNVVDGVSPNNIAVQWTALDQTTTDGATFRVESYRDDNTSAPKLKLARLSPTPANADPIGDVVFTGNNGTPTETSYADILATIDSTTPGSEAGVLTLRVATGGSLTTRLTMNENGVGFNSGTPSKPTIIGSRSGNAALQNLLFSLQAMGLIVNSTTP